MQLVLRAGQPADATPCGQICYQAFKVIAEQHHFTPDFPTPAIAIDLMNYLLSDSSIYSVVAEVDGQVAGSNFLWEGTAIAGVGPITVDPALQNASIGKKLMEKVLARVEERGLAGVRLCQAAYHNRSLSLYTKLGFDVKEPLSVIQGPALNLRFPEYKVRPATEADADACHELCQQVHGHDRRQELLNAIRMQTAFVVEHTGRITGYTTQVGFFGHTVAETNHELKALIGAAPVFSGPGFLLPSRNSEVLRWCLQHQLRVVQPMSLMTKGLYNEPAGAFLPSVLY